MATDREFQKSFLTDYEGGSARKKLNYWDRAVEYNVMLHEKVDGLKDFINLILQKQEREFLKAAKSQISQLNYEIHTLKAEAQSRDHAEELLRLRTTLDWIRDEAIKLETTCKRLKTDLARWKAKAASLEDDRNFLEKQLKDALKDRKLPEKLPKREEPQTTAFPPIKKQAVDAVKVTLPSTKSGQYLASLLLTYAPDDPGLFVELEKHLTAHEEQWQQSIAHYQRTISKDKRRMQAMNTTFSSAVSTRSELEEVFFDCVKAVRLEVQRRKEVQGHVRSKSTNSQVEAHAGGKFSAGDKKKVLELLVENEGVLTKVYEAMFPHRAKQVKEEAHQLMDIPEETVKDLVQLSASLSPSPF